MNSEILEKARKYEQIAEMRIKPEERPEFHLSTRTGWMNDPNGFSYYQGKYHIFYQYHPYSVFWGSMHWGHAVSEDLLHWEYLPAAIAPDTPADSEGCFSGSALELPDGRQLLVYTGVTPRETPEGEKIGLQTQCLAVGDGLDYEKYPGNPVLSVRDIPPGGNLLDFRDPRIWRKKDGSCRCLVGNRSDDGSGRLLLYESRDGFHWKYKKVLIQNRNRFGKMWECPDFFPLEGKQVLLVSCQDMLEQGECHNGNGAVCIMGSYDEDSDTFTEEKSQAVDLGIDFYAPQTVLAPDGRRIMTGWMQNWDTSSIHRNTQGEEKWFGQTILPRELFIKEGKLCQRPLRELETLRKNRVSFPDLCFTGDLTLEGIQGRCVDLELEIESEVCPCFSINFAENKDFRTVLTWRPLEETLEIDRNASGSRRAILHQRRIHLSSNQGKISLRLILDRFSAEVFVNGGEQVLSAVLYTDQAAEGISFHATGRVRMRVVKYDLKK